MLEIKNLTKKYNSRNANILAIEDFNLLIQETEFVSIIGPSGCGKSTILRMISGLVEKSEGSIMVSGNELNGPSREKGMVSQNFSLFPWLTVEQNILFGLDLQKKVSKEKRITLVEHYLEITSLKEFRNAYPKSLSGGMQQRVAIARALANTPKVLLMDEPFGSLDSQTRSQMQEFLTKIWEKEKMTVLFVTHDIAEAAFLSDRIVLLSKRPGKIKNVFYVPFARPRYHDLKKTSLFLGFVNRVQDEFERDQESGTSNHNVRNYEYENKS